MWAEPRSWAVALLASAFLLAGELRAEPRTATLRLVASEPVALTEDARLRVTVANTARQDVAADVVGVVERPAPALPDAVTLALDPVWLDTASQLSVQVSVHDGLALRLISDTHLPLSRLLDGSAVAVVLKAVGPREGPSVALPNLYCTGPQPFWSLDLVGGGMAVLQRTAGGFPLRTTFRGRRTMDAETSPVTIVYAGAGPLGTPGVAAVLRAERCTRGDPDGQAQPYSVTLVRGPQIDFGCCRPLE